MDVPEGAVTQGNEMTAHVVVVLDGDMSDSGKALARGKWANLFIDNMNNEIECRNRRFYSVVGDQLARRRHVVPSDRFAEL